MSFTDALAAEFILAGLGSKLEQRQHRTHSDQACEAQHRRYQAFTLTMLGTLPFHSPAMPSLR